MTAATRQDAGLASGLVNTTAQVGGAIGLAVLASLSTARTESLRAAGVSDAAALTGGFHLAFGVGAALLAVAIVLAGTVVRPISRREPLPGEGEENVEPDRSLARVG